MEIYYADEFEKRYADLPKQIKVRAEKQEKLFKNNPFHPSLHTEKLSPKVREVWSFRIDKSYRIIFRFSDKDKVLFLNVGHHHWIYKTNY